MSTQYLISVRCISRFFGYLSLGFIAKGMDWQGHLLSYYEQLFLHYWQTLFDAFGAWLLGRKKSMVSSALLKPCRCCTMRLE